MTALLRLGPPGGAGVELSARAWRHPALELLAVDAAVHRAEQRGRPALAIALDDGAGSETAVAQIALRYQRLFARGNAHSCDARFLAARARHRALHALDRPLCRADYDHTIDTWQWALRLAPRAGAAVQLACLLHDVERLTSEAERRIEHHAPDYQAFKDAHARAGAARAARLVTEAGYPAPVGARVAELVAGHERPGADPELRLLNDADALSFFSVNSAGFLAYYGPAHAARKVRWSLARMSAPARAQLARVRLPAPIAAMLAEARAEAAPGPTR